MTVSDLSKTPINIRAVCLVGTLSPSEAISEYLHRGEISFDPNYVRIIVYDTDLGYFTDDGLIKHARDTLDRYPPFELIGRSAVKIERGWPSNIPVTFGSEIVDKIRYDLHHGYPFHVGYTPSIELWRYVFREDGWKRNFDALREMSCSLKVTGFSVEKATNYEEMGSIIHKQDFSSDRRLPDPKERQFPEAIPMKEVGGAEADELRNMIAESFGSRAIFFAFSEVEFDLFKASMFQLSQLAFQLMGSLNSDVVKPERIEWNKRTSERAETLMETFLTEPILLEGANFLAPATELMEVFEKVFPGDKAFYISEVNGTSCCLVKDYKDFGCHEGSFLIHNNNRVAVCIVIGDD